MLKFVILLSAIACALGAAVPEGMVPQLDGRIVGGAPTTINNYPYQISLQRSGSHSCGGSIVKANYILTAAHCVKGVSASLLRIRAGSSYWNSGGVLISVAEIKIHSGYNQYTYVNDVAVLRLSTSIILDNKTMKPIYLASSDPADGSKSVVTGWGTLKSGGSIPSQLQYVDVSIISRTRCYNSYGYTSSQITTSMICAASPGKDSCQGDSGGPLVVGSTQVGVVSWGYGCADPSYPGVYANVNFLRSWISSAVGGGV